jgi:hypothetical protein
MTPGHQTGRAGRWHVTDTHDDYIGGQPRIVTPEQGIDLDCGRLGVKQPAARGPSCSRRANRLNTVSRTLLGQASMTWLKAFASRGDGARGEGPWRRIM